jgi:hypothetical protein
MQNEEVWKDVIGFEGKYWVSNLGRVKSKFKILKPLRAYGKDYLAVGLSCWGNKINGRSAVFRRIHRIVAEAFIPKVVNKKEVNHIDGIKQNNRVDNLEWVTSSENRIHAYKNKLIKPRSTMFTDDQVREIRKSFESDSKANYRAYAEKYKVSPTAMRNIIIKKCYKYL